jgi:hypothetical protein
VTKSFDSPKTFFFFFAFFVGVIKKGKVFRQKKSTTGAYLISYFRTHEEGRMWTFAHTHGTARHTKGTFEHETEQETVTTT